MRHGTETCYVNGRCRRVECREAHRKARARRALLNDRGVRLTVSAADLWPDVQQLIDAGWRPAQIEAAAGVRHLVSHLRAGRPVHLRTANRLRAVDGGPGTGLIPAGLTMMRIKSLSAAGWRQADVRADAGLRGTGTFRVGKPYVYTHLAEAIRATYGRLADIPGPSARVRADAARKGWPVPAAWDDPGTLAWLDGESDVLDAPRPRRSAGQSDVWDEMRWADVDHLRSYGVPDEEIAARFGVLVGALSRAERRSGRRTAEAPAA